MWSMDCVSPGSKASRRATSAWACGVSCDFARSATTWWPSEPQAKATPECNAAVRPTESKMPCGIRRVKGTFVGRELGRKNAIFSPASLRQRLGRSGRRKGEDAILRGYCIEDALDVNSSLDTKLRLSTVQLTAQISLLLDNWFEPPRVQGMHLSTLIQQLLSSIAQTGGASAGQLYSLLCAPETSFSAVSKAEFLQLLKHMGEKELIVQDSSGTLLHGSVGERFVNHYSFYAAFAADEEFRIVAGGKALGTIPVSQMMTAGQRILFAGKTWQVEEVDEPQKTIYVTRTTGGVPPLFSGSGGPTHTKVRQRMRELLESKDVPAFLDKTAARFLEEARSCYKRMDLFKQVVVDQGAEVMLLTWLGDSANEAIACLFIRRGLVATPAGPGVEVHKRGHSVDEILAILQDAAMDEVPPLDVLLENVQNLQREKWDWALPDELLRKAYASHYLDLHEGLDWAKSLNGVTPSCQGSHPS